MYTLQHSTHLTGLPLVAPQSEAADLGCPEIPFPQSHWAEIVGVSKLALRPLLQRVGSVVGSIFVVKMSAANLNTVFSSMKLSDEYENGGKYMQCTL